MSKIATTKMSSKGQIVIPEDVRNRLGLKSGDRFMVIGDDGVVVLKAGYRRQWFLHHRQPT